jgi:hypothetical protein
MKNLKTLNQLKEMILESIFLLFSYHTILKIIYVMNY